jgi:integrase
MSGCGLRISEVVSLRIKDIDIANKGIYVMEAKGNKSRRTLLPNTLIPQLEQQTDYVRQLLQTDKTIGKAGVFMPDALARKWPNAQRYGHVFTQEWIEDTCGCNELNLNP